MNERISQTAAMRCLRQARLDFELWPYEYRGQGEIGIEAAEALGIDPASLFKAVVFEGEGRWAIVLVPADRRVAPGKLMRALGHRARMTLASPARAETITGYKVGGISPFGLRRFMQVCIHESVRTLSKVYVNAGRRGLLLSLTPSALLNQTNAAIADIIED